MTHSYLVIPMMGLPLHALGAMIFKMAAMVGAISVMSMGSEV